MSKVKSKLEVINESITNRNTITEVEFKKFLPLYKKDGIDIIGEDNYNELSKLFESRFSLRDNIIVTNNNKDKVLLELSPSFSIIPTLNECEECTLTDVFLNGLERKSNNPNDVLAVKTSNNMLSSLAKNIPDENSKEQLEYNKTRDKFNGKKIEDVSTDNEDMAWQEL